MKKIWLKNEEESSIHLTNIFLNRDYLTLNSSEIHLLCQYIFCQDYSSHEPTDVEKSADVLWLAVKCHSDQELAGSPRNMLRRSS
jgi:hypothetical protein